MKDGKIVGSGKYKDLIACHSCELVDQMAAHKETIKQIRPCCEDNSLSKNCTPFQTPQIEVAETNLAMYLEENKNFERNKEEEAETGRVDLSVYSTFVTFAYKGALVPVILLCQIVFQGMQMGSNYWIAWAADQRNKVSKGTLMGTFVLLSGGSSVFILGRALFMAKIAVETAQRLYHEMITSVFRAPISFFDTTPSSRILNRVSSH